MTGIEKILKRKDASSVLVAFVLAFFTMQVIGSVTAPLANKLSSQSATQSANFSDQYVVPVVLFVGQIVAVEILVWVVVGLRMFAYAKPAKKSTSTTRKKSKK